MTVRDLIESLSKLDPEATALVRNRDGYLSKVEKAAAVDASQMTSYEDYREVEKITQGDKRFYKDAISCVVIK